MELRRIALTVMIALSSFSYGQSDTTKNIAKPAEPGYDIQSANIERSGELIQTAGRLYNASSAIAILGSTTGSILISNGDTESGIIVTSASGIAAYILQTVGNVKLAKGGKLLRETEQVGNLSDREKNRSQLSLVLRPKFGYRTYSYPITSSGTVVLNRHYHQYYLGSPDIQYSRNNLFVRLGLAFSRNVDKTEVIDPGWSNGIPNNYEYLYAPSIEIGSRINDKNQLSAGANFSLWNMTLINFEYAYYIKEQYALSLTLHYNYGSDYYADLMPSLGMVSNIGKKNY